MHVTCIDPGIVSVGMISAELSELFELVAITFCAAVDMTKPLVKSRGHHVHDFIVSFLEQHRVMLEFVDCIILERQPFQSAGVPLEIMLRERFGKKCLFVNPNTLHREFGLQGYEYNGRKAQSVSIAISYLKDWACKDVVGADDALEAISSLGRAHDVSDALLLLLHFMAKNKTKTVATTEEKPTTSRKLLPTDTCFADFIEQFRYKST